MINRDEQMSVLIGLGKDPILELLSQGVLPADLADAIEVSYATFHEFLRITCSKDELKHAEALAADKLVAEGMKELRDADDREDLAKAKAIMEINMKLAKAMSGKYAEQRPQTAIQINNTEVHNGLDNGGNMPQNAFVLPDADNLPALKPHKFTAEARTGHFVPEGIVEGEFTLYDGDQ